MMELADVTTALDDTAAHAATVGSTIAGAVYQIAAVGDQAAARGFEGIAGQLHALGTETEALQQHIGVVSGQISEAETTIRQVPPGATPSTIVRDLDAAAERLRDAQSAAVETREATDRLKEQILAVLDGGEPGDLLTILTRLDEQLDTLISTLSGHGPNIDAVIATVKNLGTTSGN